MKRKKIWIMAALVVIFLAGVPSTMAVNPFEPPSKTPEEKRKKSRIRWLILAIGIPLIALGIAYNYYGKDILKFKEKIIEKISKGKSIKINTYLCLCPK